MRTGWLRKTQLTDPDQAVEFVERTGVDALAISIGTSHGAYKFKGEPKIAFAIIEKTRQLLPDTYLVSHGFPVFRRSISL